MKGARNIIIFASLALAIVAGIWLVRTYREPATAARSGNSDSPQQNLIPPAPEISPAPLASIPIVEQHPESPQAKPVTPPAESRNTAQQPRSGKKQELLDPLAREALIYVGADPDAEAYWFGAINDPTLPPNERQDLIEDLNEEGLSDPRYPGPEDLPLILSRLELIEMLGPYAMDEVNFNAFAEAYNDLQKLAWVAANQ